jgi:hypothetical protein
MKEFIWKTPRGIRDKNHPFYDFYLILISIAEECHSGTEMNFYNGAVTVKLNQGGIRNKMDYNLKKDFKGYFPLFYSEFPEMANPFTGIMELHLAESVLREVRFSF